MILRIELRGYPLLYGFKRTFAEIGVEILGGGGQDMKRNAGFTGALAEPLFSKIPGAVVVAQMVDGG